MPPFDHEPPSPRRRYGAGALVATIATLFVIGVVGGGSLGWATGPRPDRAPSSASEIPTPLPQPSSVAPAPTTPDNTSTPEPTPSPTPTTLTEEEREQQALLQLREQAEEDIDSFPFDGRWAVQLSSKYVGSTDPFQTPASGGTKFKASDIWAEYTDLRERLEPRYTVSLIYRGNKLGANTGRKFWYVFVTDDFGSKEAGQAFCDEAFSGLPKAARDNQCWPRQLPG